MPEGVLWPRPRACHTLRQLRGKPLKLACNPFNDTLVHLGPIITITPQSESRSFGAVIYARALTPRSNANRRYGGACPRSAVC
jgi:hypothetical protein